MIIICIFAYYFCIVTFTDDNQKNKMKTNYELRYAAHPEDVRHYDTARLRRDFLIETLFVKDEANMVYSMYDRIAVGGVMPVD